MFIALCSLALVAGSRCGTLSRVAGRVDGRVQAPATWRPPSAVWYARPTISVVLCTLDGAVTRLRCFHSTQRMVDGVDVTMAHSEPADYDGQPLADILAAERAWSTERAALLEAVRTGVFPEPPP